MKKEIKSADILKNNLKKLQKENPQFSIRALSAKIGISNPFLTNILNGKKLLPLSRLSQVCTILKIDNFDRIELENCLRQEKTGIVVNASAKKRSSKTHEELLPDSHLRIFRYWWNFAILDLLSCRIEDGLPKMELLRRIPVSETDLDISLNELMQMKLVSQNDDNFYKTEEHFKIPTRGPNPLTRNFYKTTLGLAQKELDKTDPADFEKRLIMGLSCSVNPTQVPKAKKRLAEALAEVRDILTEGDCTEVYFLQAQLFNVLK
jgi:uncharacterized protein (TIGR02147 family)